MPKSSKKQKDKVADFAVRSPVLSNRNARSNRVFDPESQTQTRQGQESSKQCSRHVFQSEMCVLRYTLHLCY